MIVPAPLALIELLADQRNGHPSRTLTNLARAHGDAHVIVPDGTPPTLMKMLREAHASVTTRPAGMRATLLANAGRALGAAAVQMERAVRLRTERLRRQPHQLGLLARSIEQAAAVRTAHRLCPDAAVVVLTAAPGLHGLTGLLGGAHMRFVHEITTTEDLPLRLISRLARTGEERVFVLAPTESVRRDLQSRFPRLQIAVRAFATASGDERVTPVERAQARCRLRLGDADRAVAFVGGWWPEKDIATVTRALERLRDPLHLVVAGDPVDHDVLDAWRRIPAVRLRFVPGPLDDTEIRALYGAGDAVLVARHGGVGKESGLVVDAVRFGLPLICSEHDADLTARLTGKQWARTFPAGDAEALAGLLDQVVPAPGPQDTAGHRRLRRPHAGRPDRLPHHTEAEESRMTAQPTAPVLVAVIGPVEPQLLGAWISHYRSWGIRGFRLAFHFPPHIAPRARAQLLATSRRAGITPTRVSTGPWHEHTNTDLRDLLRREAGEGWHLLADSDEFHCYPQPIEELVRQAEVAGTGTVGGLMLDRVSATGALTGWTTHAGLDAAYPLGGFLTHHVLRGDPRKIVLAHSTVPVASGNHRSEGHRPTNRPPVVVHHFKWRADVRADLERRLRNFTDGTWLAASPAVPSEAQRLLAHLAGSGERIGVDAAHPRFRPVSLTHLPAWWADEATELVATWQPYIAQNES